MNSSTDDNVIFKHNLSSSEDSTSVSTFAAPTKSRRGRKRVTDPILVTQLKHHRRSRANDRERTRMRLLNEALEHLRTLLPLDSPVYYSSTDSSTNGPTLEDKLTKIETLRTASAYIRLLTDVLENNNSNALSSTSTSNVYSYTRPNTQQQQQQQQQQQVYQHSSYFPYTSSYSYYNPYC
ncbi:unnamed protein product [Rotaria magnacalcarata]|uniref:BHLH domain-containing protein n=1 Tax=Rotaria magnacalcarata TaxID=392030 RepID=A0A816V4W3_9BILA|nr:unnamed protein product [Rotaria magnacalcarata]CAF1602260.1 unnamed protein product [Rotaria magnacalcarata]CAF1944245.1 unnamed protein product [Rotaria magnacalcarata]CAF2119906.1 unnamed protein product [Rotaria magnacalcarata]CAF2251736.1 unnamed protein product [Rotaria magnacalcarata]